MKRKLVRAIREVVAGNIFTARCCPDIADSMEKRLSLTGKEIIGLIAKNHEFTMRKTFYQ